MDTDSMDTNEEANGSSSKGMSKDNAICLTDSDDEEPSSQKRKFPVDSEDNNDNSQKNRRTAGEPDNSNDSTKMLRSLLQLPQHYFEDVERKQPVKVDTSIRVKEVLAKKEKWLVFADLHVNSRSWPFCQNILRFIHDKAKELECGVLFLGDFFDTIYQRGQIAVSLLNEVQRFFSSEWLVPMVMLPGNHDMFGTKGEQNGLWTLQCVNKQLAIISSPMVEMDALWLPYERDEKLLADTVKAHQWQLFRTIFGHMDIRGAIMSSHTVKALHGLEYKAFGTDVKVFTGHFHCPEHHPETSNITYVGSPYQITANEAGQTKRMLLLQHHDKQWKIVEDVPIPLSLAPQILLVRSNEDFGLVSDLLDQHRAKDSDKINIRLPQLLTDYQKSTAERWRKQKLIVHEDIAARVPASATLSHTSTNSADTPPEQLLSEILHGKSDEVQRAALRALTDAKSNISELPPDQRIICFTKIALKGFGPYSDQTEYTLNDRGLVAIIGKNSDDQWADSNGSGKSMIINAIAWAILGEDTTGRTAAELRNLNNDEMIVTLEGLVNDSTFRIERSKGARPEAINIRFNGQLQGTTLKSNQIAINKLLFNTEDKKMAKKILMCNVLIMPDQFDILNNDKAAHKRLLIELGDQSIWAKAQEFVRSTLKTLENEVRDLQRQINVNEGSLQESQQARSGRPTKQIEQELAEANQAKEELKDIEQKLQRLGNKCREFEANRDKATKLKRSLESSSAKSWEDNMTLSQLLNELHNHQQNKPVEPSDDNFDYSSWDNEVLQGIQAEKPEGVIGVGASLAYIKEEKPNRCISYLLQPILQAVVCRTQEDVDQLLEDYDGVSFINLQSAKPPKATHDGHGKPAIDYLNYFDQRDEAKLKTFWSFYLKDTYVFDTNAKLGAYFKKDKAKLGKSLVSLEGRLITANGLQQNLDLNNDLPFHFSQCERRDFEQEMEQYTKEHEEWLTELKDCEKKTKDFQTLVKLVGSLQNGEGNGDNSDSDSENLSSTLYLVDLKRQIKEWIKKLFPSISKNQAVLKMLDSFLEESATQLEENQATKTDLEEKKDQLTKCASAIDYLSDELSRSQQQDRAHQQKQQEQRTVEDLLQKKQAEKNVWSEVKEGPLSQESIDTLIVKGLYKQLEQLVKQYLRKFGDHLHLQYEGTNVFKVGSTQLKSVKSFSSGQRQKIELATRLAMGDIVRNRYHVEFNVIFFDEVFSHLDTAAHSHVMEFLPLLLQSSHQSRMVHQCCEQDSQHDIDSHRTSIFVVSHAEEFGGVMWTTDVVVHKKGKSKIITHNEMDTSN